jgi:hypothetical protein
VIGRGRKTRKEDERRALETLVKRAAELFQLKRIRSKNERGTDILVPAGHHGQNGKSTTGQVKSFHIGA